MVMHGLDESYWDSYAGNLRSIELTQVNEAAKKYLRPNAMLWVIVGDLTQIEEEIRAAIHVVSIYCGVPQGLECFRAAREALEEAGEL